MADFRYIPGEYGDAAKKAVQRMKPERAAAYNEARARSRPVPQHRAIELVDAALRLVACRSVARESRVRRTLSRRLWLRTRWWLRAVRRRPWQPPR